MKEKSMGTSPWGSIQRVSKIGPGFSMVSTAGHGGARISPTVYSKLSDYTKSKCIQLANYFFLEEDCNAQLAIVELTVLDNSKLYECPEYKIIISDMKVIAVWHHEHFKKMKDTFIEKVNPKPEDLEILMAANKEAESQEIHRKENDIFKVKHPERAITSKQSLSEPGEYDCIVWTVKNEKWAVKLDSYKPSGPIKIDLKDYSKSLSLEIIHKALVDKSIIITGKEDIEVLAEILGIERELSEFLTAYGKNKYVLHVKTDGTSFWTVSVKFKIFKDSKDLDKPEFEKTVALRFDNCKSILMLEHLFEEICY